MLMKDENFRIPERPFFRSAGRLKEFFHICRKNRIRMGLLQGRKEPADLKKKSFHILWDREPKQNLKRLKYVGQCENHYIWYSYQTWKQSVNLNCYSYYLKLRKNEMIGFILTPIIRDLRMERERLMVLCL